MKPISVFLLVSAFAFNAAYAAEPVVNIDPARHPNLNAAQKSVVEAYNKLTLAQKDNNRDMSGHAAKAKEFLEQADKEIRAAATEANEANKNKKK